MATGAIRAERALVLIPVAIETRLVRDALELEELRVTGDGFPVVLPRVTFHAGDPGVFALQLEARLGVGKRRLFPSVGVVTAGTFLSQLAPVFIRVTIAAGGLQSQVGSLFRRVALLPDLFLDDVLRIMALPALQLRVIAFQDKPRLLVIEVPGIPPHDLKRAPVVLLVAT